MFTRGFAARRTMFLVSLATALALVLALGASAGKATLPGPGGGACAGYYGGMSASRTIDGTVIQATWCWNAGDEITALWWSQSQQSSFNGNCAQGIAVDTQSNYQWQFNANETLTSNWTQNCSHEVEACTVSYWIKATVWAPPNPNMSAATLSGPTTTCPFVS